MSEKTRSIRSCEGYEILKSGRVGERYRSLSLRFHSRQEKKLKTDMER